MKVTFLATTAQNGPKRIPMGLLFAFAVAFLHHDATAQPVDLGTASSFAILAGSQITDAGGASRIITGDVGLYPTTGAALGLTAGQVPGGTIYRAETADALLNRAQHDLTLAFNTAAGRSPTIDYGLGDNQLGGRTLFPGVYRFGHAPTANLNGTLTLDANGISDAIWIFQATSDLLTAAGAPGTPGSSVVLINGANACNVFWEVGSSATIGTYSRFVGNIMADQSITMNTSATLDHNTIAIAPCAVVPEPGTTLLLASGLVILFAFRRRLFSRARAAAR